MFAWKGCNLPLPYICVYSHISYFFTRDPGVAVNENTGRIAVDESPTPFAPPTLPSSTLLLRVGSRIHDRRGNLAVPCRPFPCRRCPKSFTTKGRRRCHRRYHCTGVGDSGGNSSSSRTTSSSSVRENKAFSCLDCLKDFSNLTALQAHSLTPKHVAAVRAKVGVTISCPRCPASFGNWTAVKEHFEQQHPSIVATSSSETMKTTGGGSIDLFAAVSSSPPPTTGVVAVLPSNSSEVMAPYVSPVCRAGFRHAADLGRHLAAYTDVNHHAFPLCRNVAFPPGPEELRQKHSPVVQGDIASTVAPTPTSRGQAAGRLCRYCNATFPDGSRLRSHARTCSAQKPFKCRFCARTFGILRSLERHNRKHWTVVKVIPKRAPGGGGGDVPPLLIDKSVVC